MAGVHQLSQRSRRLIDAAKRAEETESGPSLPVDEILHAGQMAPFLCALATVVICAGRRWGKSVLACVKAYSVAMATPDVTCCLIGATQGSISRIFWRTLKLLNRLYLLGGTFLKGVEGWSVTLRNGSQIVLLPVDTIDAADKVRGLSRVAFVCVDESQRYKREILDYLVLDVIKAMFIDLRARGERAQLWLMGTPNPAGKLGTFWDYLQRQGVGKFAAEPGSDAFTVYENAKLGTREQIDAVVEEMLAEENVTKDSAWYQREVRALWVVDLARRVYYFDDDANTYDELPPGLSHFAVIGDIGVRDADALGAFGWQDDDPTLYLVEEVIKRGQDTLDLADAAKGLVERHGAILAAFDAGGLGLKVVMTVQKLLPGVPVKAVDKPPVNLQVKALNDRLRRGFKCSRRSAFYAQIRNSEWVDGVVNGKIQETGHSDIVPTGRYAALELARFLPDAPEVVTVDEHARREKVARIKAAQRAAAPKTFESQFEDEDDGEEFYGV